MAVAAIKAESRDVVLVTKRHLLRPWHVLIGCIRRPVNGVDNTPKKEETERRPYQAHAKERIATFAKDLGHAPPAAAPPADAGAAPAAPADAAAPAPDQAPDVNSLTQAFVEIGQKNPVELKTYYLACVAAIKQVMGGGQAPAPDAAAPAPAVAPAPVADPAPAAAPEAAPAPEVEAAAPPAAE